MHSKARLYHKLILNDFGQRCGCTFLKFGLYKFLRTTCYGIVCCYRFAIDCKPPTCNNLSLPAWESDILTSPTRRLPVTMIGPNIDVARLAPDWWLVVPCASIDYWNFFFLFFLTMFPLLSILWRHPSVFLFVFLLFSFFLFFSFFSYFLLSFFLFMYLSSVFLSSFFFLSILLMYWYWYNLKYLQQLAKTTGKKTKKNKLYVKLSHYIMPPL